MTFTNPLWFYIVEFFLLTVFVNAILVAFWHTRSIELIWGTFFFLAIFFIISFLKLPLFEKINHFFGRIAAIAFLIIFQNEIRVAISKLNVRWVNRNKLTDFDNFLDQISLSLYRMAENHTGGLIVLQHHDSLDEYIQKAVILNAEFSAELLESIFAQNTPLHDGAVIIKDRTIVAASVILPLAELSSGEMGSNIGTRHRASLGLSYVSDALVIAISASGKISVARDGVITYGVKINRFKGIVRSIFYHHTQDPFLTTLNKKCKNLFVADWGRKLLAVVIASLVWMLAYQSTFNIDFLYNFIKQYIP